MKARMSYLVAHLLEDKELSKEQIVSLLNPEVNANKDKYAKIGDEYYQFVML